MPFPYQTNKNKTVDFHIRNGKYSEMVNKRVKTVNRDKSLHLLDSQVQHILSRTSAWLNFNETNSHISDKTDLAKVNSHIEYIKYIAST